MEDVAGPKTTICFLKPDEKPDLRMLRDLIPKHLIVAHLRPSGALGIWYDGSTMLSHLKKRGKVVRWFIDQISSHGFICHGEGYWVGSARNEDEARFILGALANGRTLLEHAQAIQDAPGLVYDPSIEDAAEEVQS